MNSNPLLRQLAFGLLTILLHSNLGVADTIRVATYNVENYLDQAAGTRYAKSAAAKVKIRESIRALKPDVLALQEMGSTNALLELHASLKAEGPDYPYWDHVSGWDTNIHVAVLSKFPFATRHPHTDDVFLLSGRRFHVSRGFAEVDINVNPSYSFKLITAHLKSRRPIPEADEAELRLQEARVLREKIDAHLAANPNLNLVVLGDFNDVKDSKSTKAVIGTGRNKLVDTRPAERNGDNLPNPNPAWEPCNITWTYYYGKEDTYSRIDYLLLSPGMAREWVTNETYVLALPNWAAGSDHRPLVATFETKDK